MAEIIQLADWQDRKIAQVQSAPALECPTCARETQALYVASDSTTTYRCAGHGHRALTWRIDPDGNMLRGASGKRYF